MKKAYIAATWTVSTVIALLITLSVGAYIGQLTVRRLPQKPYIGPREWKLARKLAKNPTNLSVRDVQYIENNRLADNMDYRRQKNNGCFDPQLWALNMIDDKLIARCPQNPNSLGIESSLEYDVERHERYKAQMLVDVR